MYLWSDDTLRWMMTATRHTPLYSGIASLLEDIISSESIVCDAGCGTGGLSLALAPKVRKIVAVDSERRAIDILKDEVRDAHIDNIAPICADIFGDKLAESFDTMIFCRFGRLPEILPTAYRYGCEKIVIIKQKNRKHRFDFQQTANERNSSDALLQQLDEAAIPYESRTGVFESGQPFTSLADARAFFKAYDKSGGQKELSDAQLMERIMPTGKEEFPYHLPAQAEIRAVICDLQPVTDS